LVLLLFPVYSWFQIKEVLVNQQTSFNNFLTAVTSVVGIFFLFVLQVSWSFDFQILA